MNDWHWRSTQTQGGGRRSLLAGSQPTPRIKWLPERSALSEGVQIMVKMMLLLHGRQEMSVDQFRQYWHQRHRPLLERLPGLQRLVLNDVLPCVDGTPHACDGIAEDWFESPEAMQTAFASAEGRAVAADAAQFLDLTRMRLLVVAETDVPLAATVAGWSASCVST
jgi:uncharacterized protein (TIGR02118 family)